MYFLKKILHWSAARVEPSDQTLIICLLLVDDHSWSVSELHCLRNGVGGGGGGVGGGEER